MTRQQEIDKILKPLTPKPGAEFGDWILQNAAFKATGEMLNEKYDADESRLWESFAPQFYQRTLEDMRATRASCQQLRDRMKAKGYTDEEVHRRIWHRPGRGARARYNKIKPDSEDSILRRKINRLFK